MARESLLVGTTHDLDPRIQMMDSAESVLSDADRGGERAGRDGVREIRGGAG